MVAVTGKGQRARLPRQSQRSIWGSLICRELWGRLIEGGVRIDRQPTRALLDIHDKKARIDEQEAEGVSLNTKS